jgi:hypothetical protein
MSRLALLTVALVLLAGASNAHGQDSEEVKRLKKEIELLQAKLEAANLKIEKLQKENEQLKAGGAKAPAVKAVEKDAFAKDALFTGRRIMGKDIEQHLSMVVTKRDGTQFEGELTIEYRPDMEVRTLKVTGTAPVGNGAVKVVTEKSGKFKQTFTGQFNNGEFGFDCGGTSRDGSSVSGKGVMRAK